MPQCRNKTFIWCNSEGFVWHFQPLLLQLKLVWETHIQKCMCTQWLMLQDLLPSEGSLGGCMVLVVSGWCLKAETFLGIISVF